MVTIESLERTGKTSWLLKFSSDQQDPIFYIYLDGVLVAQTSQTQYELVVNPDEYYVIEVLDDANAQPMQIFPGKTRLSWFGSDIDNTKYYRIDEYISSQWVERKRMPEKEGYIEWESRFLEDGTTHQFRVTPVATDGNEGTARQFNVLMVRHPDVPDVGYGYDSTDKQIEITEN